MPNLKHKAEQVPN